MTTSTASSTYAPKASPTFTGTISLNGDVTLASASTNTLTLNDHLVLVTGTNFTTPISGQQGYIITGTNTTDSTAITSGSNLTYSTIDLSYGVWMVFGQIGLQNLTGGTQATMTVKNFGIHTAQSIIAKYANNYQTTSYLAANKSAAENISRIVTVTTASTPYYLVAAISYTNGPL